MNLESRLINAGGAGWVSGSFRG